MREGCYKNCLPLLFQDDVDDDRGAHDGGDGIEGNHPFGTWRYADDVAQKGHCGTGQDGGWHQEMVIVCAE